MELCIFQCAAPVAHFFYSGGILMRRLSIISLAAAFCISTSLIGCNGGDSSSVSASVKTTTAKTTTAKTVQATTKRKIYEYEAKNIAEKYCQKKSSQLSWKVPKAKSIELFKIASSSSKEGKLSRSGGNGFIVMVKGTFYAHDEYGKLIHQYKYDWEIEVNEEGEVVKDYAKVKQA